MEHNLLQDMLKGVGNQTASNVVGMTLPFAKGMEVRSEISSGDFLPKFLKAVVSAIEPSRENVESGFGGAVFGRMSTPIVKAIQESGGRLVNSINTTYGPAYLIENPATGKMHRFFEDEITRFGLPRFGPERTPQPSSFMEWLFKAE